MSNRDLSREYDAHTIGGSVNTTKFNTPGIYCLHEKYLRKKCNLNLTLTITLTFITTLNFITTFFRFHIVTFFSVMYMVVSQHVLMKNADEKI